MAVIRLYMSMSVDGYIAGPDDSVADPMGIGGFRVFDWLDRRNDPGPNGQVYGEAQQPERSSPVDARTSMPIAGRAITMTEFRSSC